MKKLIFSLFIFMSSQIMAAPFVVSDPTAQAVTHCGVLLDAAAKVDIPVVTVTDSKICKIDLSGVLAGPHTIRATFINIDPVWGRQESVPSAPFTFIRPVTPMTPGGLVIIP